MMMEDTRRQVAMGDMVHDMLVDRPPSPARMEYRSDKHARYLNIFLLIFVLLKNETTELNSSLFDQLQL